MPRQSFRTSSPLEDKVRRLEDELYMARATIIGLARSPELVELLRDQYSCKTFDEVRDWAQHTADSIIESASRTETPAGRNWDGRLRVLCPLCGDGPQSPYDDGFLLDEGLRRHLLGTYNSRQCSVFEAAHQIALDRARREAGR
ncbi:hypothetical protein BG97_3216 [Burkholderia pseudomallei 7894]|uniref:hypothetical protein n=1 Tax=Burkholderia pseudomallei TaxID=28450 RepID=UPI0005D7BB66|nr:hypothetical protein [Burkholderia pseudomallei]AJX80459.1 hypothetical protein BG97_3216 [Burkholderia pseudomallei 7894]